MDLILGLRRELREVEWKLFLLYRGGVWDDEQERVLWCEVDRLEGELSEASV
jgi:hypothetical protein